MGPTYSGITEVGSPQVSQGQISLPEPGSNYRIRFRTHSPGLTLDMTECVAAPSARKSPLVPVPIPLQYSLPPPSLGSLEEAGFCHRQQSCLQRGPRASRIIVPREPGPVSAFTPVPQAISAP